MDKQWHVMALVLDLVPFRVIGIALANMSSEDFIGAALSPAGTPLSGFPAGFLHFFRKEFTEKQVYKDMETISNEPFYSSANIAAKSKAQSKAREIEVYYDNAFSLQ